MSPAATQVTPESQLRAFIAGLDPKPGKLLSAVRTALRKRFPTANELAYDYGHSIVIAYSPTENGIEGSVCAPSSGCVVSVGAGAVC